jgi:predicted exporter
VNASLSVRWASAVERWHRVILITSLLMTFAAASSLLRLRFDFDVLDMLPTGAPAFDDFKGFVSEFGELDQLVFFIEGPEQAALRSFADALAERLMGLDSVETVQARLDVEAISDALLGPYLFNYLPAEAQAQVRERLSPAGIEAQMAVNRALLQAPLDLTGARQIRRDPLGLLQFAAQPLAAAFDDATLNLRGGYLASADGTALLVVVRPALSPFDIPATTRFLEQVRAAEAAARASLPPSDMRVRYSGSYVYALEDAATIRWDVARYSLLALTGVLAIFYAGYRNFRVLPFVTYPLVLSTLLTFAASLLIYEHLNAVSLSFAAILYGLSIDSGIHYFTRLSQEARVHDLRTAVASTLGNLSSANVAASSTTAAVFAVIGFSDLAGVSQLGVLTAVGMLVNIVEFVVLYPALSFWMAGRGGMPALTERRLDTPRLGRLGAACARHAVLVVTVSLALCVVVLLQAREVSLDATLTHLRPSGSEAASVEDEMATRFGITPTSGAVLVRGSSLEEALQGSERMEALLQAYRSEGMVDAVRGITALMPSARTQRERLAFAEQLPRDRILADLRVALQRHRFDVRPFADFFASFAQPRAAIVDLDTPALRPLEPILARHVRVRGGHVTVALYVQPAAGFSLEALGGRLRREAGDVSFVVTGRGLLEAELARMLRRELWGFFLAAFMLNFVLIVAVFRHGRTAVAVLLPQVVVIAFCLALMRITGIGVGPVNLVVVPLVLGIGVDHCIYVAERWWHGCDAREALTQAGRALVVSGLTTTAGFGFLGLSRYPALADMGTLAASSLVLCLLLALTMFPALLALLAPPAPARHEKSRS